MGKIWLQRLSFVLASLLLCVYIYIGKTTAHEPRLTGSGLPPDALEYIAQSESFSQPSSANQISFQSMREPVFPIVLSLLLKTSKSLNTNDFHCLKNNLENCADTRLKAKKNYALVIFMLGFSVAYVLFKLSGSLSFSFFGLTLVSTSNTLWLGVQQLLSEPLVALLLLWTAYLFKLGLKSRFPLNAVGAGVFCALLSLTKFAFLPLVGVYCLALLIHSRTFVKSQHAAKPNPSEVKPRSLVTIAYVLIGFSVVYGSWLASRSFDQSPSSLVASRASRVISTRANYNQMTVKEYAASFVYWSSGAGPQLAKHLFEKDDYTNLERTNPNGYFLRTHSHYIESRLAGNHDAVLKSSLWEIAQSPFSHLLVSLPIFYRGLFIETGFSFGRGAIFEFKIASAVLVGPLLFLSLILLTLNSVRSKHWEMLVFYLPVFYSISFHVFVTHNIPRYGYPLIPLLIISTLLILRQAIAVRRGVL